MGSLSLTSYMNYPLFLKNRTDLTYPSKIFFSNQVPVLNDLMVPILNLFKWLIKQKNQMHGMLMAIEQKENNYCICMNPI